MKWLCRLTVAVLVLLLGLAAFAVATALRSDHPVGFQTVRATGPHGSPFAIGVWYPTHSSPRPTTFIGGQMMDVAPGAMVSGKHHPLVIISHGNGGGPGSHADLAMYLASAGYVVAAPMHAGDNYADQSAAGSVDLFSGRNRELHASIDFMLDRWQGRESIDRQRIGAYGLSAGGFTVLTAVGALPDLSIIPSHCASSPEFVCKVLRSTKSPLVSATTKNWGASFLTDTRIKAAVVAAPGLAFTLAPAGLANVGVPIQLWSAELDDKVPYATNTGPVRELLGDKVEFHSVPGAGHTSFLAPCGLLAPPAICRDPGKFDRKTFHRSMNASVLAFFEKNLNGRHLVPR